MYGKAQRTQNDEQVTRRDGEALLHAQQIRARRCNNNAHPNRCGHAFFEEQTEYRHNHDVKRRQKPGLAHCRKADAELLQIRGHGKRRAAQHAAHPQGLAALLSLFVRLRFFGALRCINSSTGKSASAAMKLRTPLNANGPKWSMPRLCATNAVPQIRAVIVRSKAPRNCFMKIPFKS